MTGQIDADLVAAFLIGWDQGATQGYLGAQRKPRSAAASQELSIASHELSCGPRAQHHNTQGKPVYLCLPKEWYLTDWLADQSDESKAYFREARDGDIVWRLDVNLYGRRTACAVYRNSLAEDIKLKAILESDCLADASEVIEVVQETHMATLASVGAGIRDTNFEIENSPKVSKSFREDCFQLNVFRERVAVNGTCRASAVQVYVQPPDDVAISGFPKVGF